MDGESKHYTIIISEAAADMLVLHIGFLAQVSKPAAEKTGECILQSIASLQSFPERNPRLSDPALPSNKYYKLLVDKRYLVVYQIKGNTVFVDMVVDCRQDYKWLL